MDLTGQKYGMLTVIKAVMVNGKKRWECLCDCGGTRTTELGTLRSGKTTNCGCWRKKPRTHGLRKTVLYTVWSGMKQRCINPKHKDYHSYGGRGIVVCEEWSDFKKFYDWSMENGYRHGLQIDRKNNELGYFPENCKFSTPIENNRNKRNNVFVTIDGEIKTTAEWSRLVGLCPGTLTYRLSHGYVGKQLLSPRYSKEVI